MGRSTRAAQAPRVHDGVCGPLAASCQLANTWALGSIPEVPLFTSDS